MKKYKKPDFTVSQTVSKCSILQTSNVGQGNNNDTPAAKGFLHQFIDTEEDIW